MSTYFGRTWREGDPLPPEGTPLVGKTDPIVPPWSPRPGWRRRRLRVLGLMLLCGVGIFAGAQVLLHLDAILAWLEFDQPMKAVDWLHVAIFSVLIWRALKALRAWYIRKTRTAKEN